MFTNIKLNLAKIESDIDQLHSELDAVSGQCDLLTKQIGESKVNLESIAHSREVYKKEVELFTILEKATTDKTKKEFESLVTYALRYIYNEDYSFELEFGRRGNLQEMDLNIKSPEFTKAYDPLDTEAGGILDVASIALRVVLIELSRPRIMGFLCLDEIFKHLSKNYISNAHKFVKIISQRFKRQIIMVTHNSGIIELADKSIKIE